MAENENWTGSATKRAPEDEKITFRRYKSQKSDTTLLVSERALPTLKNASACARLLDPAANYELGLPERLQTAGLAAGVETHCSTCNLDGFSLDLGRTLLVCTSAESLTALTTLARARRPPSPSHTPHTPTE